MDYSEEEVAKLAELLMASLEAIRPAMRALVSCDFVRCSSSSRSRVLEEFAELRGCYIMAPRIDYHPFRCLYLIDVPEKPCYGSGAFTLIEAETPAGPALCTHDEGEWFFRTLSPSNAVKKGFDPIRIIERLHELLDRQLNGNSQYRTQKAQETAEKLWAVATLLKQ